MGLTFFFRDSLLSPFDFRFKRFWHWARTGEDRLAAFGNAIQNDLSLFTPKRIELLAIPSIDPRSALVDTIEQIEAGLFLGTLGKDIQLAKTVIDVDSMRF